MEEKKCIIRTDHAPAAAGPYSQGIGFENLVFVSGQLPIDPDGGNLLTGPIEEQTKRSLDNVKAVLEAAGSDMSKIIKTTIFLADMDQFAAVNQAYAAYFESAAPARSCVEVAGLPKGGQIEIEAIAFQSACKADQNRKEG